MLKHGGLLGKILRLCKNKSKLFVNIRVLIINTSVPCLIFAFIPLTSMPY